MVVICSKKHRPTNLEKINILQKGKAVSVVKERKKATSQTATEVIGDWLIATLRIIDECPCEEGCPSCVQDPQCGSGNQPLDKEGAKELLKKWLL